MGEETDAPESGPPASGIRRIRLLLVDSDDEARTSLCRGLESRFEIVEARSAREALAQLENRWFRIILADYRLNDQDGVRLLRRVARRSPYTWRVLMSTWSVPKVRALRDVGV